MGEQHLHHQVTPTSFLSTIELVVSGIHSIQVAGFIASNQPQSHTDQLWTEKKFQPLHARGVIHKETTECTFLLLEPTHNLPEP